MKDLSYLYLRMSIQELNQRRSVKYLRMVKLQGMSAGYFINKEISQLQAQIRAMDAALEAKKSQLPLL